MLGQGRTRALFPIRSPIRLLAEDEGFTFRLMTVLEMSGWGGGSQQMSSNTGSIGRMGREKGWLHLRYMSVEGLKT